MTFSIKQKYVFFLFSLLFNTAGIDLFGQVSSSSISDLRAALADAQHAENRIDLLNDLSYAYRRKSLDSLHYFAKLALAEAKKNDYKKGLLLAYKHLGIYTYKKGLSIDTTLALNQKALRYAIEIDDNYNQAALYNNIGLVKAAENKHRESIKYYLDGLNILKSSDNNFHFLLGLINGNLGLAHQRTNNPELAFQYLQEAQQIALTTRNQSLQAIIAAPLGRAFLDLGKIEEGKQHLHSAIQLQKSVNDYQSWGYSLLELADQLITEGQYQSAQKYIQQCKDLVEVKEFSTFSTNLNYQIARIHFGRGRIESALLYAKKALNAAEVIHHFYAENRCHNLLSEIYAEAGQHQQAFDIQKKLASINDSLNQLGKTILAEELEAQYQFSKKEQEIAFLNASKKQQKILIWVLGSLVIMGFSFLIFLTRTQYRSQKDKQIIQNKNAQLKTYIEQNLQLENFAHIASHDLKTPLRNIASFSQLLSRKLGDKVDEDIKIYLRFITNGSKEMMELTNDLLTYSTLNKKVLCLEQLNIEQFLQDCLSSIRTTIEETQTTIKLELPVDYITADAIKLRQVFQNLILNAIKFRAVTTNPHLVISVANQNEDWLFSVADNGIGIPYEFQEKIFLLLKRLHNRDEYEGTGIGLAICKRVIEQHEGQIWVNSEVGQGSTFYFSIPKK